MAERWGRVDARYRDEYPDMAAQVPLERLRTRYGADWKGDNYGTKEAKVWQGVESAVADVAVGCSTNMAYCSSVSWIVCGSMRARAHVVAHEAPGDGAHGAGV